MQSVDVRTNSGECDKEQPDLEPMGSFDPPFFPTESLVDDVDEIAHLETSGSENASDEQESSSTLQLILPAAFYIRGDGFHEVIRSDQTTFNAYLSKDLDTSRLDAIQDSLWLAGLERPARSLQELVMLGRQIIVTEQTDLHMVWHASKIYIKPLPEFLLCHGVWKKDLCQDSELYRRALGLLFSYVQLVQTKSDLRIAHSSSLLPNEIMWGQWARLSRAIHRKVSTQTINPRYRYGELRLARLNWIYRFKGHVLRGYASQESRGWLVGTLVYITIVLTAMQVGLGTTRLSDNLAFQRASYGFTVFSIMGPVIVLCTYWGGMIVVILWNLLFTLRYVRRLKTGSKREYSWVNKASSKRIGTSNDDIGVPHS